MMKKLLFCFVLIFTSYRIFAQQVIDLSTGKEITTKVAGDHEQVVQDKKTGNRTIFNVNKPSVSIYKPSPGKSNGVAIIICPGGAFHVLDVDNEGFTLAKMLVKNGYTAVVLKYRLLVLDAKNPFAGLQDVAKNPSMLNARMAPAIPFAIEDTKAAFVYLKLNATKLGIDAAKIGIIGFSAGGTLAAAIAYQEDRSFRPAFSGFLYPYLAPYESTKVPEHAVPLFIAVAADDDYGFDVNAVKLQQKWKVAGASAELHVYPKGKHGFGTKKQNLPVDHWIDSFGEWLNFLGYPARK
jgi:acetyl esterase/lipase